MKDQEKYIEKVNGFQADFWAENKRERMVIDIATVMQRSRFTSIFIDIIFLCMLYIGSVFSLVMWLRHQ